MAGDYIRGAFIAFTEGTFSAPTPNVIIFQYNPETMTHSWEQPDTDYARTTGNPLALTGDPVESFSFNLAMDANDTIANGVPSTAAIATASGLYSRLAALEMLQFPVTESAASAAANNSSVPQLQAPTILFVWGAGRIVPVRLTSLKITETLYDVFLNPVHAEADIDVKVVTSDEMAYLVGPLKEIAKTAYDYNKKTRQGLAVANLANAAEGVIGMLQF
jgi:hypothetical protein